MDTLSSGQFDLVFNLLSLTIAAMFAAGIFFLGARQQVAPRYRLALLVSAVVVFIAGYHYFRIWESWKAAFVFEGGSWIASGVPFNDAYRYADWLITVPLLLVELIAVLGLSRMESGRLIRNLTIASFAMILLGYPGEVATAAGVKWLWWALAMVPFGYILYVLYTRLSTAVASQGGDVPRLLGRARTLLVLSWWVYPVAFVLPMIGLGGAMAEVGLQVGYSIADLTAKAGFGIVIYQIARAKSESEGYNLRLEREAA
jgi:bacteriorhodopsin